MFPEVILNFAGGGGGGGEEELCFVGATVHRHITLVMKARPNP